MNDSTTEISIGESFTIENVSDIPVLVVVIGVRSGARMERVIASGASWRIEAATESFRITEEEMH